MLQNRVDPWGNIISTPARGAWMGNRGLLHNERQEIIRPFKLYAWIICKLDFKGRKRQVMTPNNYTELFFLDEATAFAAGHRPCFECQREAANHFKACWIKGNPEYGFNMKTPIGEIDKVLHKERIDWLHKKRTFEELPARLPDGVFVADHNIDPCLVKDGYLHLWTPSRYTQSKKLPTVGTQIILTPLSIINTFRAGYRPQIAL